MDRFDRYPVIAPAGEGGRSQRSRSRDSLFLMGQLTLPDESAVREVRVRNLSAGGLMIEIDRVVAAGTAVKLSVRGIGEVTGVVAWCAEGRIGIALDRPIEPQKARKPIGSGARTPAFAKPQLR